MPIKSCLSLVVAVAGLNLYAKPLSAAEVDAAMAAYRKAPAVEARVKKTIHQEVMNTKNESEGRFYFSKGKLRLDFDRPERSTLVYDGRTVWLESRLDDKHVQVSRVKSGALRKSNSLMAALFDNKDALKAFRLLTRKEEHGLTKFAFEPRDRKATEVRSLEIALDHQALSAITYRDEMENKVEFQFKDVRLGPVAAAKFKYQPPKGASVTNL